WGDGETDGTGPADCLKIRSRTLSSDTRAALPPAACHRPANGAC
ncbi:MAG: hypothetical protein AVDCRST_MAG56-5464, partial [uncultured Cytophagales bacterium]